ncbi:MAG: VanZ family protein [Clostridia bacterium]|nr:VanZ family protein [Clostridia bacterium]
MSGRNRPIDRAGGKEYNTPEREVTAVKAKTKKWILIVLIGALTLAIWGMSLQTGNVSNQQTEVIVNPMVEQATAPGKWLSDVPPPGSWLTVFTILIRKGAHFLEFALLGVLWGGLSRVKKLRAPWLYGLVVAVIDETIQYFVPGRAPGILDVALDYAGYLFGFGLIVGIVALIRRKSKN